MGRRPHKPPDVKRELEAITIQLETVAHLATRSRYLKNALARKTRDTARIWRERWGFYCRIDKIQEEEAEKIGMSKDEYRAAVRSMSSQPEPKEYPVTVVPSPKPLPPTSSGMIGRRAQCKLERYGPLVKTGRDYPTRPPLKPGQIYDPCKQTLIFLGSVDGDPISYKLPPSRSEVTDAMWSQTQQLVVSQLHWNNIENALRASQNN